MTRPKTRQASTPRHRLLGAAAALTLAAAVAAPALAEDNQALSILKSMTDYVGSQSTIAATFDSDIEVVTTELEKIQFTSSGKVQVSRPNMLHAQRTGGYSDVELFFDGKAATLLDRAGNRFATIAAPGTLEEFRTALHTSGGAALPGADLLMADAYETLTADVTEAKYVGQGVIDGVNCEHLAFRTPDNDWQLWVATGDRPVPCKMVITSKTIASAPQYTLRVKSFETGLAIPAETFAFAAPAGATEASFGALASTDEVPPATTE